MNLIQYAGHTIGCAEGENLLAAFLRTGLPIDFSCKSGACHRCLVKVVDGVPPAAAARRLPAHLQQTGYVLACQCTPTGSMGLAPKDPADMLTECTLVRLAALPDGAFSLWFEPATELEFTEGQTAEISGGPFPSPSLVRLVGRYDAEGLLIARVPGDALAPARPPLGAPSGDPLGGASFQLRGPFAPEPEGDTPLPEPDLELWRQLGHGALVRRVLEAFYPKVYADPLLQPFFERVSMERVIGKQYAFLSQCMTGDNVYLGERPKNAHHWMVIPEHLFEHRQSLMAQAQREQGLTPAQMAGWAHFETHFRSDIVKHAPWPKRMGPLAIDTERYDSVTLDVGTVCDHCGAEIAAHSTVRFHARLGHVGCPACAQG